MSRLERTRLVACGFEGGFELTCVNVFVFTCVHMCTEFTEQHWVLLLLSYCLLCFLFFLRQDLSLAWGLIDQQAPELCLCLPPLSWD